MKMTSLRIKDANPLITTYKKVEQSFHLKLKFHIANISRIRIIIEHSDNMWQGIT